MINNKKFFYENNKIFSLNTKKIKNNNNNNINIKNYINLYYNQTLEKKNRIQQLMFSDSLFINRVSNYIGGKTLIFSLLKKSIFNFNNINLWFIKNKLNLNMKKKLFIEQYVKKFPSIEDLSSFYQEIIDIKIDVFYYNWKNM